MSPIGFKELCVTDTMSMSGRTSSKNRRTAGGPRREEEASRGTLASAETQREGCHAARGQPEQILAR